MRILMTGATGFVGKKLGQSFVRAGHDVVVLSRNPKQTTLSLPFPCKVYAWDASRDSAPATAFKGVEAIVHLAGEPVAQRWTAAAKKRIYESRVLGTEHLLKGLAESGEVASVKTFVSTSATGFYGDRGDEILNEEVREGRGFLARVCRDWEQAAMSQSQLHLRRVTLRIGVVLGRQGGALEKMLPIFRMGLGGPLGDGKQWMSWIHFDDLLNLFTEAVLNPKYEGIYNAVAPEPVTNREFTQNLGGALKKTAFLPAPRFGLKLAFGEMSKVVLESQRVNCARVLKMGFRFRYEKLEKALSEVVGDLADDEEFCSEQWVNRKRDEMFPFFCSETNLEQITPPWLGFHVVKKSTPDIREGTIIDYKLKLHGLPLRWQSRIELWEPGVRFSDTQLKGPYKKWHHTHEFHDLGSGTLLVDRVRYRLSLGVLGYFLSAVWIRRDIQRIFKHRQKVIGELFGPTLTS